MVDYSGRNAWSAPGWPSEGPGIDGNGPQGWVYPDRFSYQPGETVRIHGQSTVGTVTLRAIEDRSTPRLAWQAEVLAPAVETPEDAYAVGCGWPVITTIDIDDSWAPGFYRLEMEIQRVDAPDLVTEHFFIVRPAADAPRKRAALLLTTSTLIAYNDWGGANYYRGIGQDEDQGSPILSTQRPVSRGFIWTPPGAPRPANPATPLPNEPPRYPQLEWSRMSGFGRHYCDAFWATYEKPFAHWAEREGFDFDFVTQHDLHVDPAALRGYRQLIIVGHDEYWSWQMRDALDSFVDEGGHVSRFGGNFIWQVRISEDGHTQTCYKHPDLDPYWQDSERRHLTTTAWDLVGRPGAASMGLTGQRGIYNRYGSAASRSSGGFTVYRPEHWSLAGTGLGYADVIGATPVCAAGFEVDGLDYTFRHGLPYPTGVDGGPEGLEIIAMAPAVIGEPDLWGGKYPLNAPESDASEIIEAAAQPGQSFDEMRYGSGMVAAFSRGKGSVFNAGAAEWVNGLILRDPFIQSVTSNVLHYGNRDR